MSYAEKNVPLWPYETKGATPYIYNVRVRDAVCAFGMS